MAEAARFVVGTRVRATAVDPPHHTRVPRYVRGQVGTVVEVQGVWGVPAGHWVHVELWESYLEEAR